jgi:hypothetical protein
METNRNVKKKTVVKTGGTKKTIFKDDLSNISTGSSFQDYSGGSLVEGHKENNIIIVNDASIHLSPFLPFIHRDFHFALNDIPPNRIDDLQYIHFHIFAVWFLSKLDIPIPHNLPLLFLHFKNFPFFSSLFHIRNNIS